MVKIETLSVELVLLLVATILHTTLLDIHHDKMCANWLSQELDSEKLQSKFCLLGNLRCNVFYSLSRVNYTNTRVMVRDIQHHYFLHEADIPLIFVLAHLPFVFKRIRQCH